MIIKKNAENKVIALDRINVLFNEAKSVFSSNRTLADRYVSLARKISMKYKVKIPSCFKRSFCKHCYSYLVPSVNSRVRVREKMIVIYCDNCKRFSRFRYKE